MNNFRQVSLGPKLLGVRSVILSKHFVVQYDTGLSNEIIKARNSILRAAGISDEDKQM